MTTEDTGNKRTTVSFTMLTKELEHLNDWAERDGTTPLEIIRRALTTELYLEAQQAQDRRILIQSKNRRGRWDWNKFEVADQLANNP